MAVLLAFESGLGWAHINFLKLEGFIRTSYIC